MKNNSKRICALLLAIVMCIGCVVPVFAESDVHVHSEAVCPGKGVDHTMANCTTVYVKTVDPQCGAFGYDLYECTTCKTPVATNWTNINNEGHVWGEYEVTTQPTCDTFGEKTRKCQNCDATEKLPVAKREHSMTNDKTAGQECKDGTPAWNEWCTYDDCDYTVAHGAEAGHDCEREVVEIVKQPTCYETGIAKVACTHDHCSYVSEEVIVLATGSLAHTWDTTKTVVSTAPTCGTAGSGTVYCSVCKTTVEVVANKITVTYVTESGATATDEKVLDASFGFAATGVHSFTVDVPGSASNCTESGIYAHKKCATCDALSLNGVVVGSDAVIDPADGHSWVDHQAEAANCTTPGKKAYSQCSVCSVYTLDKTATPVVLVSAEDLVVPPAHSYDLTGRPVAESAPTCTMFGFKFYGCVICGMPAQATGDENFNLPADVEGWVSNGVWRIPMVDHDYSVPVSSTPGNCTTDAVTVTKCSVCGDPHTDTQTAPGHNYQYSDALYVAPTCQTDGSKQKACTVCGDKLAAEPILANDSAHVWDENRAVITTPATCTKDGVRLDFCKYCSHKEERPYSLGGHDFSKIVDDIDPDCVTEGHYVIECAICEANGPRITVEAHNIRENVTVEENEYAAHIIRCYEKLEAYYSATKHVATGHSYVDANGDYYDLFFDLAKRTCTTDGEIYKICDVCDARALLTEAEALAIGFEIARYNHTTPNGSTIRNVVNPPLCGVDGSSYDICSLCQTKWNEQTLPYQEYNKDHHASAGLNADTVWHDGVEYADKDAADAAAGGVANGVYRNATCYVTALYDYKCASCGLQFYYEDAAAGHVYSAEVPASTPDCLNGGNIAYYTCTSSCGAYFVKVDGEYVRVNESDVMLGALGHDFSVHHAEDPADCLNTGVKEYYDCSRCSAYSLDGVSASTASRTIDALGHDFSVNHIAVAPKCEVPGTLAHKSCSRCDAYSFDGTNASTASTVDPALSHVWVNSPAVTATCVTPGYQYHYCKLCGDEYVDLYKYALGHTFQDVAKENETCAVAGTEAHVKCTTCSKLFAAGTTDVLSTSYISASSLVIPATGAHKDADGNPINDTCAPGMDTSAASATCAVCQGQIAITHSALASNDVDATCTEYGYTAFYCKDCGYQHVQKKPEFAPTGHNYQWVVLPGDEAGMYTEGLETEKCVAGNGSAGCGDVKGTRVIPATGGIEFSFNMDNAIVSGAEYVNGGKIKVTIYYKAANIDLANVMLRLDYDASVLSYVSGDFKCAAVDAATELAIFDSANASIGGKTAGYVVISAKTTGFGEAPANKKLDGEGVFAEVYFNVKQDVSAASEIWFKVAETGDSASKVLKANGDVVSTKFGTPNADGEVISEVTKALGDINIDGSYDSADEVKFLNTAFSGNYVAEADINQDGIIFRDDYVILQDLLLGNITYAELCANAQSK